MVSSQQVSEYFSKLDPIEKIPINADWLIWLDNNITKEFLNLIQKRRHTLLLEISDINMKGDDLISEYCELKGRFYELGAIVQQIQDIIDEVNK